MNNNKFSDQKLNTDNLIIDFEKIYELPKKREDIKYDNFIRNNWKKHNHNALLNEIEKKGGAIWLDLKGKIMWRRSVDGTVIKMDTTSDAERVLGSYLHKSGLVICRNPKKKFPDIDALDLKTVEDLFTPDSNSEFYIINGNWYRTSFIPSDYICGKYECVTESFDYIDTLVDNLVDGKEDRKRWVYNWLAGFFQHLEKSRVSLVLRGEQGSGKGLFFTEIITPLFGKEYCVTVSDENLESDFKPWVDEKLFYNLNEVAVDIKSRRSIKNFLKQFVSDEYLNVQSKFKDFKQVKVYGNILITSNEAFPIEVELSDRRFTVFQTGKSLKSVGANIEELIVEIRKELATFAKFLKEYKVDWELYNTALDTPEKSAIVDGTTSTMKRFIYSILKKDKELFVDLENSENINDLSAYNIFDKFIHTNRISIAEMFKLYSAVFETKKTIKRFALELRNLEPEVFNRDKICKSGNYRYYEIL